MVLYLSLIMIISLVVSSMGRTKLSKERIVEVQKENIGKIIIFCEGMTEKNYMDYFADIINKNKYTDILIETESSNGNARNVLNFANSFLLEEANNRNYTHYNKYLVFDCDDPPNIQEVIKDMVLSDTEYSLLVSNFLFEIWLLMHFENVDKKLSKRKIYERLNTYLNKEYKKADPGIIREIIQIGSIEEAIKNCYELDEKYRLDKKTIINDITEMNPYTNVHKLIEQFMLEIS
jgi:hypothetical protein